MNASKNASLSDADKAASFSIPNSNSNSMPFAPKECCNHDCGQGRTCPLRPPAAGKAAFDEQNRAMEMLECVFR